MNKTGGMESMKIQHIAISEKSKYTISLTALAVGLIVFVNKLDFRKKLNCSTLFTF